MTTTSASFGTAVSNFFTGFGNEVQILESDVLGFVQKIGAGLEVVAEDLQQGLSWLGSHIGLISETVTAINTSVSEAEASGVPIPPAMTTGLAELQNAMTGVTQALNSQTMTSNPSAALSNGYYAAKALMVAAGSAATVAGTLKQLTAPAASGASAAPAAGATS